MKTNNETQKRTQATARPWQNISDEYVDGLYEGDIKTQDGITICHLRAAESDELEANAAMIVEAVNQHAALVAVAEAAKQYAAVFNDWNLATLENALAKLKEVRS